MCEIEIIKKLHHIVSSCDINNNLLVELLDGNSPGECEILDFKRQIPVSDTEYLKTVRDLIAFHNSYGGLLIFGVEETEKDRAFEVVGISEGELKSAKLNDLARSYLQVDLRIFSRRGSINGKIIEIVLVAKRANKDAPVKFVKNGPEASPGKLIFKKGEVVFRRIGSNAIALQAEDYEFLHSDRRPPSINLDINLNNNLPQHNLPDRSFICSHFIGRSSDLADLWRWLADDFSRVRLIAGEGGLGKTSLAYRFAQDIVQKQVKPFEKVVWLTAKKRQFIPSKDAFYESILVDYDSVGSLFKAVASEHGALPADFEDKSTPELMCMAIDNCTVISSFIIIDDIDSLTPEDQRRALEFGMRAPQKTKILLTTRVNFSYSSDNVLKLSGLIEEDYKNYVKVARDRFNIPLLDNHKLAKLRAVTGGSPLFTDSLLRLEKTGLSFDQAITQWQGKKGIEARKAALLREIKQLSKEAKRTLFVISSLKSAGSIELLQVLDYTEQTFGDAVQELSSLFLVNAPPIGKETRYTVEPNTGLLIAELTQALEIDHAALTKRIDRIGKDATGLSKQRRSNIIGLAISQANAFLANGDPRSALDTVTAASRKLSRPHADLLLAVGRFNLALDQPNFDHASKNFAEAYELGQRKQLLFDLWFDAEYQRGNLDKALNVSTYAVDSQAGDKSKWHELQAKVHVALANRSGTKVTNDAAIREIKSAITCFQEAKKLANGNIRKNEMDILCSQAQQLLDRLVK